MTISLFRAAYSEYWDAVESGSVEAPCKMLPYDYVVEGRAFVWESFVNEFTRELLNTINGFADQINNLTIWTGVLSKRNEEDQLILRYEFTALPLYYCLHKPREFRERFVFCLSHLCHQANCICRSGYQDRLEPDHRICIETLRRVAAPWNAAPPAIEAVSAISAAEFDRRTRQFRNRTQHRIPPSLEYGHTNFVTRSQDDEGRVGYTFGFLEPITTESALPLLIEEWQLMRIAFDRYWQVVEEQDLTMRATRTS